MLSIYLYGPQQLLKLKNVAKIRLIHTCSSVRSVCILPECNPELSKYICVWNSEFGSSTFPSTVGETVWWSKVTTELQVLYSTEHVKGEFNTEHSKENFIGIIIILSFVY